VIIIIKLKNLTKSYDGIVNVVDGLDLEIEKGKIVVLIGKSGSGKSTTLRMINRLIGITSGDILIDDKSIKDFNPIKLRRKIGYVIQKVGLMLHMTVGQNIEIIPFLEKWPRDERKKRAMELLELVDLPAEEFYNRYPAELSGGQQQRVGVARALAANPDIILMDEPFSALDPITRDQLQLEIIKLQEDLHKTIVFVTHDMDEALKIGDKIAVLKDGKILQYDTPEGILKSPKDDYVREFVGAHRLWQSPEYLYAKDLMRKNFASVGINRSTAQAIEVMKEKDSEVVYITESVENRKNILKGLVTLKELKNIANHEIKMKDIMKTDFNFVFEDTNMVEVLNIMQSQRFRNIPVVNEKHQLTGIITRSSLLNVITDVIPEIESM
jgi:osmoprotectant transport system ATP-binding protein